MSGSSGSRALQSVGTASRRPKAQVYAPEQGEFKRVFPDRLLGLEQIKPQGLVAGIRWIYGTKLSTNKVVDYIPYNQLFPDQGPLLVIQMEPDLKH